MNILIAPNAFKESLSSKEVIDNLSVVLAQSQHHPKIVCVPLSDGGEGFVHAVISLQSHHLIELTVENALGDKVNTYYGMTKDKTAVIEMALASGLEIIDPDKRDPMMSTTYGTGQLINDAISRGAKKIIIGLGGSATNDGGVGMARALGVKFLDNHGDLITTNELQKIHSINIDGLPGRMRNLEVIAACDVTNPLLGPNGATAIYGPQKGASAEELLKLERNLEHLDLVVQKEMGVEHSKIPGAGAAGGLGYGLITFLQAILKPGFDIVSEANHLDEKIQNSDLIITGEGKLDEQTLNGKTIQRLSDKCTFYNKPLIVVCGISEFKLEDLPKNTCITQIFQVIDYAKTKSDSLAYAASYVQQISADISKTFLR